MIQKVESIKIILNIHSILFSIDIEYLTGKAKSFPVNYISKYTDICRNIYHTNDNRNNSCFQFTTHCQRIQSTKL